MGMRQRIASIIPRPVKALLRRFSLRPPYPFNYYLNFMIWSPYVFFLFLVALASRVRNRNLFRRDCAEKLPFFFGAPQAARFSMEFLFQKSLEGQIIVDHRRFLEGPVLDIGIGEGTIGLWFQSFLPRIDVGLDALFSQSKTAFDMRAYEMTTTGLAEALPFRDGSFSSVLSVCVMEHVKDVEEAFREIYRVLRPGGHLVMTVISETHDEGLLPRYLLRKMGLSGAADRYTDWLNRANCHHRPRFGLLEYERLLSDRFHFVTSRRFWSIPNRRLYDLIGWPCFLLGYRYGNLPLVHFMLRNTSLRWVTDKMIEWLLVPKLLDEAKESRADATHLFIVLQKKGLDGTG